jgi:DNA mismatch repair ATPase MutS
VVAAAVQTGVWLALRHRAQAALAAIEPAARALAVYAAVLDRWRREPVDATTRQAADAGPDPSPLGELTDLPERLRLAPLSAVVLGTTRLALAVEDWRRRHGRHLADWLRTAGRVEALTSLATYAYENADDPFPELAEAGPLFDGTGLRHPLMPHDRCVPNDVRLDGGLRLLLVSGSNMSGKSTLLRTVGTNVVLAWAGAPVRAERLRLSPLAVGATLRVQDSLQQGVSRFFAEIRRLRQILDLAHGLTSLLFLLDEVLSGTNSEDRRAGAEAVLTELVTAGAVGLATTHDLALTGIAERLAPRAVNVHFAERLEGDDLVFDYRMKPGVVKQSNALALMRAVGIRV